MRDGARGGWREGGGVAVFSGLGPVNPRNVSIFAFGLVRKETGKCVFSSLWN